MQPPEQHENPAANIGWAFAAALASGDFAAAHQLLAPTTRNDLQPADLAASYAQMMSYWTAPADSISIISVDEPGTSWPGKEPDDVAWVFVGIDSHPPNSFVCLEAIAVRVVEVAADLRIKEIVWGRP
jgi:hypothetical protein